MTPTVYQIETTEQGRVGELSATVTGSLSGSVTVANGLFTFPGPNEPASMTLDEELSYNNVADLQTPGSTGSAANYDATAISPPYSSPRVVRFVYQNGSPPGGGGSGAGVGNNRTDVVSGAVRQYIAINFYLSDPFTHEASETKFLYFYRTTDVGSLVVGFYPISGVNGTYGITANPQVAPGTWIQNSGDVGLTRGAWHYMEVLAIMNTTTSAEDGTLKIWVDGVLVINSTTMKYGSSGTLTWHRWNLDPYWGGNNANTIPQEQYLYVDHSYSSSSTSR